MHIVLKRNSDPIACPKWRGHIYGRPYLVISLLLLINTQKSKEWLIQRKGKVKYEYRGLIVVPSVIALLNELSICIGRSVSDLERCSQYTEESHAPQ